MADQTYQKDSREWFLLLLLFLFKSMITEIKIFVACMNISQL